MSTIANDKKRKPEDDNENDDDNGNGKIKGEIPSTKKTKKNGVGAGSSSCVASKKNGGDASNSNDAFKPLTLKQIRTKITKLKDRVPTVPPSGIDPHDKDAVRTWASTMQAVIEEFNLLLCCVSAATYKWGTDRSGAADQNLGLLSSELGNAQDQITTSITPRLTNVLAPVVDLVNCETITTKDEKTGEERKVNKFRTEENDPGFVHLCRVILCRNAVMLRLVFLTNVNKIAQCVDDYLKATKKDGSNSRSNFAY